MPKQKLIGYVFKYDNGNKYYGKYYFEQNGDKIARFIMQNIGYRVVITDTSDDLFCISFPSGVLDYVADQNFLENELLPAILEYQNGKSLVELKFYEKEPREFFEK